MIINVTAEDIKNGICRRACRCPIALAAKRAGLKIPWVCGNIIICPDKKYTLPLEATKFIRDFDKNKPVEPFSFNLETT